MCIHVKGGSTQRREESKNIRHPDRNASGGKSEQRECEGPWCYPHICKVTSTVQRNEVGGMHTGHRGRVVAELRLSIAPVPALNRRNESQQRPAGKACSRKEEVAGRGGSVID